MRHPHNVLIHFFILLMLMSMSMIGTANAASLSPQVEGQNLNGRTVEETFGGVVVGQTVSVAAQDFMQYFVAMWRDKPHNERYTIVIHERPSARWGNLLWIEYQREKIFQTVLPHSRGRIKSISEQAVDIAWQELLAITLQQAIDGDALSASTLF